MSKSKTHEKSEPSKEKPATIAELSQLETELLLALRKTEKELFVQEGKYYNATKDSGRFCRQLISCVGNVFRGWPDITKEKTMT